MMNCGCLIYGWGGGGAEATYPVVDELIISVYIMNINICL